MCDIDLEVTCIYVRNHAQVKLAKEEGKWKDKDMEGVERLLQIEIEERSQELVSEYCLKCHPNQHEDDVDHEKEGINAYMQFLSWAKHFSNADFIRAQEEKFEQMEADLLAQRSFAKVSFEDDEISLELTPEKYLGLFKLIYATIRIDLWLNVTEYKKEAGQDNLPLEKC